MPAPSQPEGWLRNLVRLPGWESRLTLLMRQSYARAFDWGGYDCTCWAADDIVALTGFDAFMPWRRRYSTIGEATAIVDAIGGDLLAAARRHLAWVGIPEAPWQRVRQGDIGAWQGPRSAVLGICLNGVLAVPQSKGFKTMPLRNAAACWRIG